MQKRQVATFGSLVACDQQMVEAFELAHKASGTNVPVLLQGESGTGKQALAFAIHAESSLKDTPFHVMGSSAEAPTALESVFVGPKPILVVSYGHEARSELRLEKTGTLYIDEVTLLNATAQFGLLSLLDELRHSSSRIGSETQSRFRVIASTNTEIQKSCKEGLVRLDLFYAMSVIHITLPPLRERLDDIVLLAEHFLQVALQKHNKRHRTFSWKCVSEMGRYGWPGNLDELRNKVERAVILSSGNEIGHQDIGLPSLAQKTGIKLYDRKLNLEKQNLQAALGASEGNVAWAARTVGLSRQNFYRLVKKHSISISDFRK